MRDEWMAAELTWWGLNAGMIWYELPENLSLSKLSNTFKGLQQTWSCELRGTSNVIEYIGKAVSKEYKWLAKILSE